jgi:saccharopine dehydrogenase (NAD+, L-lysine forming)
MLIHLRHETKPGERRTPLTPAGAKELIAKDFAIHVESSSMRIFTDDAYRAVGCDIVATGSWPEADKDAWILGLKELPDENFSLIHKHIYFAHAYKEQTGWQDILGRFKRGGGTLYDLEFLKDETGRRVAAFGYWAGYAGAAVAVDVWVKQQQGKELLSCEVYTDQKSWIEKLKNDLENISHKPTSMVMGALGRSGKGASDLFAALDLDVLKWDMAETKEGGPFPEILQHNIFINCVLLFDKTPPFLTKEMLKGERKLSVISDVSCDPTGPVNPLPIYDRITTMTNPVLKIETGSEPLDLIAIDHLPSLLPKESSLDYEQQLLPHLKDLKMGSTVWDGAKEIFRAKTITV